MANAHMISIHVFWVSCRSQTLNVEPSLQYSQVSSRTQRVELVPNMSSSLGFVGLFTLSTSAVLVPDVFAEMETITCTQEGPSGQLQMDEYCRSHGVVGGARCNMLFVSASGAVFLEQLVHVLNSFFVCSQDMQDY